ncbi:MAG TPA: hypothetical protein VFX61_02115 [Micromonosporaceae bacterium]|nr:hypothetical protein [Micromonosporaceae bacterium]
MRRTPVVRRWGSALIVAMLATTGIFIGTPASAAAIVALTPPDEGDNKKLRDALEAAAKGHLEAKAKLDNSKKRQLQLRVELSKVEDELAALIIEVGAVADQSYRIGRLTPMSMLLNSSSPEALVERAAHLDLMAQRGNKQLRALSEAREQANRAKQAIDFEVAEQQRQLAVLAKRKKDAERALASVGGRSSRGYIDPNSPLAKPAPRNGDGSWPKESCSVKDPTTGHCITPRTLHALREAQAAGFKRHVSCFRSGGSGEHPKGRACDFSAAVNGFENVHATGGDKTYGDNLASFYIKNANRLGVMYVIWYKQIWMPNTGWRTYNGGTSPAGAHTNHVHLSML